MTQDVDWPDRVKRYLKAELKRQNVSYAELAKRLAADGMNETEASITNKIARGAFTASFFVASLKAIGCETVNVDRM